MALLSSTAFGKSTREEISVTARISPRVRLALGVSTISFPDASPFQAPAIAANENGRISVSSWVRTPPGTTALLTVEATGDLKDGAHTIAAARVGWTASGASEYRDGKLGTAAQTVASFARSGIYEGAYQFFLENSADYVPGDYSTRIVYTLLVP